MKERKDTYNRIIDAFRYTESFDDMLTCEDVAELFLNLAKHFVEFDAAEVRLSADGSILASRELTEAEERRIAAHVSSRWLEYIRRELRAVMIPESDAKDDKNRTTFLCVPFFFGWNLLGHAVLSLKNAFLIHELELRIIEILSRAAGVAMGRITQSAQIEAEKAHTRNLMSSIVSPLVVVDHEGAIKEANAPAESSFGKGLTGRNYRELFGFLHCDPIRECLESGEAQHRVEVFGKGGRLWGVTVSPHQLGGAKKGAVIGFRDLTDLKQMEEKLASTERQAIIGRLSATVAHEVNNPLGAMKAHLKLLMRKHGEDDETVAEIKIISDQVDRIARTVRLLLNFSRQRNAPKHTFNPAEIIRTVIALFEESFREKGAALHVELADNLPMIAADTDQFQEVLINIIENSRDALGTGKTLAVRADARADAISILIEDDGPGLGREPEKLFEPFFTTKASGTGLGLTIARRICESIGGSIAGENRFEDGTGARFKIELPVK